MKNKLYITALTAAVMIPAMVVSLPVNIDAAALVFKDITKSNQYYTEISEMASQNIISGYEDGTFRAGEVITRKHAAALVNRQKGNSLKQTVKFVKFKDVSEKNPNFNDIRALQQAGIFSPDAKGNFNPDKALTRAGMAKVLVMAYDLDIKSVHNFSDVPANSEYSKFVQAIYSNGITVGNDGKYLPNDSLTRAHYAVFMHRAMNMDKNFFAPPIVKPTPPVVKPTPGGNGYDTGLITDKYAERVDVPRPPGYVKDVHEENHKKESNEIARAGNFTAAGGFAADTNETKSEIERLSKKFGLTVGEFTGIINDAIKTGRLYNGGNFVLYYDYKRASVTYSMK